MNRPLRYAMIVLELAAAGAFAVIALRLPDNAEVRAGFDRAETVTDGTARQIGVMKKQVGDLRASDTAKSTAMLKSNARTIADTVANQQVDFDVVESLGNALDDVATAIDGWADANDLQRLKGVSDGLAATAGYIETNVIEAAAQSAGVLEFSTKALEEDANRLAELLRRAPPDLKAVREIHDALGTFDTGLGKLGELVTPKQFQAMKEGLQGMENSLNSTADQSEKIGGYSYPVVTVRGLKLDIENKPFWPEGKNVAEGLRQAGTGVKAVGKELDDFARFIPDFRKSIEEGRMTITRTRAVLATTIKQEAELEKLMADVGKQTATLAESLPKLGRTFSKMLRETDKLKAFATSLRGVKTSLDGTLERWPATAAGLKKSSQVLRSARSQLQKASANRAEYEKAIQSTGQLARSFSDVLPGFVEQVDLRLEEHEKALAQMERGLVDVTKSMPKAEETTLGLLGGVRLLLWIMSALIGLHAIVHLTSKSDV